MAPLFAASKNRAQFKLLYQSGATTHKSTRGNGTNLAVFMRSSTEESGSGEKANLAAGPEAAVEVVLVHPVLEVADPNGLILLAPVPAGSGRGWGRRAAPGRSLGRRGRPSSKVLGKLRRRRRWRGHHGRRRRVRDDDPPWLRRHVVVRVTMLRGHVGVGVRVVRRHGRLGVGGGRRHLHRRRSRRRGGGSCGGWRASEGWRAEKRGSSWLG